MHLFATALSTLLASASKMVFLLLASSACVGFFMGILDPKDFMLLATASFSFYFAHKGSGDGQFGGK